ncbi:MAG: DotU family type IV/VI secretion system protein [Deltaproteobacteria bacterium]|jgi:type VI protein secretion system component VasF|nr:DotU family type IV/VI secretion system protein [Deltaproteobacteria bacterium]
MRFAARFFKILHFALQVSGGEKAPDWEKVRADLSQVLAEEKRAPFPPGFGEAEAIEARVPVWLFVDERFLSSSFPNARLWYDLSLQRQFLATNQGGELFFQKLLALLSRRALALGPSAGEGAAAGAGEAPPSSPLPPLGALEPLGSLEPLKAPEAEEEGPGDPWEREGTSLLDEAMAAPDRDRSLERIVSLWREPGAGPEPLESLLDSFAVCLCLGFRGMLPPEEARPAGESETVALPARAEEIIAKARAQISRWRNPREGWLGRWRVRRGPWRRFKDFWRDYDWVFYHVLIPLAVLGIFYLKGAQIIESLPF